MSDPTSAPTRDEFNHSWGKPYYGHRTCHLCGIPDSSPRARETCLNPHGIVATDAEVKAAAKKIITERRVMLEKLAQHDKS